ncbi:enolase C-terminal domain-like protein [Melioribacter sp. Ez-97]|uniref:enolase C-terminal domain-like protein n=1 Tax=Melioribacter sp. Ez-97 TaxID=3423434 RepID=UPI003EDAD0BC
MKIGIDKYFKYTLKFKKRFSNASASFDKKDFLIIKFNIDNSYASFGEASVSYDSDPEKIISSLNSIIRELPTQPADAVDYLKKICIEDTLRYALEQPLLFYLLKQQKNFFKPFQGKRIINVNAIIDLDDIEGTLKKIEEKVKAGFGVIKIKAGRKDFEEDLKLLKRIDSHYGDSIALRLDINGKWDYHTALERLPLLTDFNIEYIEDPADSLEDNLKLAKESKISVVLDQTLPSLDETLNILSNSDVKQIVVKPSIRFGVFNTIDLIDYARKLNKQIVISSAFETSLGKSVLAFISSFAPMETAHGLDVYDLTDTSFYDPFPLESGKIRFDYSALSGNFEKVYNSIETRIQKKIDKEK